MPATWPREIIAQARRERGDAPADMRSEEIVDRLVLRMVAEAFRVLEEGIVERPADIDVAMVLGTGLADFRGGVLKYACDLGLDRVLDQLEELADECGERYAPCDLLRAAAADPWPEVVKKVDRHPALLPVNRTRRMKRIVTMPPAERKDFEATKKLRDVMGKYFADLGRGAAEGKKTAWCTSVGPAELLWAMGFNVYFPENHGAMLGASRMATDLIPLANARGFSPDICSYLTSDVGSYLKGESPLQKMKLSGPPKPDVLVFNTNQCRDVKDWFQFYAREWNVPCLGVHTPRSIGDVDEPLVDYVAGQIEALVEPLEQVAGQKLDIDRLREVIDISRQTHDALEGGAGNGGQRARADHVLRRHDPDGPGRGDARPAGGGRLLPGCCWPS